MGTDEDSLFSLELVIEKLYLPHTICRFPAVAFRLLDFPTILIKHVEDDLGKTIKKKISMDPYYQLPNQFDELKDKHGNFMIKKGKSCLFKISVNTFRKHLSTTPLYMMILDNFHDVKKLVGNSSIPLDAVIEAIHADISKMGNSIPSVHGDKGLFKVYSLMGKEIGYVILGYRLLSLGPGLLPHIPNSAISNRMSEVKETMLSKTEKKVHVHMTDPQELDDALNNTRDMGSMTDVQKCDVLLQTVETCDKDVNVALLTEKSIEANQVKSSCQTSSTQTEQTRQKKAKSVSEKVIATGKKELDDDDDGAIIIANVIRPPPLFYNRDAEPQEVQHPVGTVATYSYDDDTCTTSIEDDITVENLSDHDLLPNNDYIITENENIQRASEQTHKATKNVIIKSDFGEPQAAHPQISTKISHRQEPTDHLYPLLSALLDELISLKGKRQVSESSTLRPKAVSKLVQQTRDLVQTKVLSKPDKSDLEIKLKDNSQLQQAESKAANKQLKQTSCVKKSHRKCAHPSPGVPKYKGWIRQVPEYGIKKTKLVFGLTNTQRLRLAKGNPDWLKSTEKEVKEAKAQKQKSKEKKDSDHDFDTGNLSDTLTEVRRLASRELNETQMTLDSQYSMYQNVATSGKQKSTRKKHKQVMETKDKSVRSELSAGKQRSPGLQRKKGKNIKMKKKPTQVSVASDVENVPEDNPELQSQRSIEVKIPKTDIHSDGASEDTLYDSEDDHASPKSEKSPKSRKFPGFVDKNSTLPDSIGGRSNMSLDISTSSSEEAPLESTRASKDHRANFDESRMFQSTEDYDTKQFHSTDEPELQRLISKERVSEKSGDESERSEASPAPITNSLASARKFQVINPVVSQQSPIPALRRSQLKLDSLNAGPSATVTPRSYSSQSSSKRPTPRPRIKSLDRKSDNKRDIHTESISSYFPSEMENLNTSITSDPNYSDDFQAGTDDESVSVEFSSQEFPKLIPSAKLGYTIG